MFNGVFLDVLSRIPLTLLASSGELHLYRTELSGFHRPDPPKQLQAVNLAPLILITPECNIFFLSSTVLLCRYFCFTSPLYKCALVPFFSVLFYLFVSPFFPPPATQRNTPPVFSQSHFKIATASGVTDGVNCCLRSSCLLEKLKPRHFMKWKEKKNSSAKWNPRTV